MIRTRRLALSLLNLKPPIHVAFPHRNFSVFKLHTIIPDKFKNHSNYVVKISEIHTTPRANRESAIQTTAPLQIKKRSMRKKRMEDGTRMGKFNVFAYATAEEYDLEKLHTAITKQDLYETRKFFTNSESDALHVRGKYEIDHEPHDIFFFREGSVVLWNCTELEASNVMQYLRQFEISSYDQEDVISENELMNYTYTNEAQSGSLKNGDFFIRRNSDGDLEKYTFSNAMTSSVKLGIWEAMLDKYIESIEFVTEDLKEGRNIKMTRAEALRKTGELFALKHLINLSSDLLETPDFYWDRENLERLFVSTCSFFSIQRRKRVSSPIYLSCAITIPSINFSSTFSFRSSMKK